MALNFFLRMLFGHLLGDFVFQPYKIAIAKRAGWHGLLLHVSIVTLTTGLAIYRTTPDWLLWTVVLFGVHLFIDQFRTYVFTDNSNGKSFFFFVMDQVVHVISIMAISYMTVGWQFGHLLPILNIGDLPRLDLLLLLASLLIMAIWVVPILEVELATAIIARRTSTDEKRLVPIEREDRVLGSIERLISVGLIILSKGLFIPLVFLPRFLWLLRRDSSPDKVATYSKMGTSFITALVISLPLWVLSFI